MTRQVKAELLKVRSTRTTIGLLMGMIALILLFTLLTGLLTKPSGLYTTEEQRTFLSLADLTGLFSALAGAMLVASEYRYGTICPTILFTPDRSRVIAAKALAGIVAGLAFGIVGTAIGWAVGYTIISGRGIPFALSSGDAALLVLGGLGSVALWGAIGVGVGAILRNQVVTIITLLAWAFIVDPLLFGLVPSVGRFMPTDAADGLIGRTTQHLLAPAAGAVVLTGWTLLLAAIGLSLTVRRDVN